MKREKGVREVNTEGKRRVRGLRARAEGFNKENDVRFSWGHGTQAPLPLARFASSGHRVPRARTVRPRHGVLSHHIRALAFVSSVAAFFRSQEVQVRLGPPTG